MILATLCFVVAFIVFLAFIDEWMNDRSRPWLSMLGVMFAFNLFIGTLLLISNS